MGQLMVAGPPKVNYKVICVAVIFAIIFIFLAYFFLSFLASYVEQFYLRLEGNPGKIAQGRLLRYHPPSPLLDSDLAQ